VSRLIGGRIDFARVPGGPWIVSSWHIRMPEVAAQRQSVGALRPGEEHYSLVGLHEVGGEVLDVGAGRGAASTPARGGTLAGVVYDSAGFVPLANVEVALVGTARSVRTGPDGRFQLHGLPDGRYGLRATPRAWDLPWPPPEGGTALVREGDTTHIRLQLPGADDIVAAVCDEPLPDSLPGVVLGRLTDGRGRALAGDTVVVSWNRYALQNGADVRTRWQAVLAVTDGEGRYRACGLPLATPLRAAAVPPHSSATRTTNDLWLRDVVPANARQLRIDGPRVVRLDLSVRRPG
ncbi:MAG TPA: carboxypeptidase-like regulatory domain-containing protein, partial [Longimicrobiales bacterium]|nr:carboxypeptidase-like regulatory domain-containing protein [Longimicrobiales bacterium]